MPASNKSGKLGIRLATLRDATRAPPFSTAVQALIFERIGKVAKSHRRGESVPAFSQVFDELRTAAYTKRDLGLRLYLS